MKKILILFLAIFVNFNSFSQSFSYSYDASGNRIHREMVELKSMESITDTGATKPVVTQMGEMSISVFPNPTAGALRIEITNLPDNAQGSLIVWNLQGQELLRINSISSNLVADLSTQPSGNYIMRINVGGVQREWKIVKE